MAVMLRNAGIGSWIALACLVAGGCAPGDDDSTAPVDTGRDARDGSDATGQDDGDASPETAEDSAADEGAADAADGTSEAPDAPDMTDVAEAVDEGEPDIPFPGGCTRSGPRDCSPQTGPFVDVDRPAVFRGDVTAAVDAVVAANPGWFYDSGDASSPFIYSESVDPYMSAVTDWLYTNRDLCASGPGEELGVKHDTGCSESYDIVATPDSSTWRVRRPFYTATSIPSYF
ncbi:MAG: hypothetical protein JXB32_12525 [Deltaproteobacteria bacterium]|nr:hypothetical protein [Deltaproteobacteria bacterium]